MNLTPDQFAELIRKAKPHLIKIEEEIEKVDYGTIEVKLSVRAGVIEKMEFVESRVWLRPKE